MNRLKNIGLVLCGLALGLSLSVPAAQAVESLKATLSTNRILVDGQEVRLTAYNINGNNYVHAARRRQDGRLRGLLGQLIPNAFKLSQTSRTPEKRR